MWQDQGWEAGGGGWGGGPLGPLTALSSLVTKGSEKPGVGYVESEGRGRQEGAEESDQGSHMNEHRWPVASGVSGWRKILSCGFFFK